jgi:hypothetical protein
MLDQKVFENIENKLIFDVNDFYKFYFDREDLAINQKSKYKGAYRENTNALELSKELLNLVDDVYHVCLTEES